MFHNNSKSIALLDLLKTGHSGTFLFRYTFKGLTWAEMEKAGVRYGEMARLEFLTYKSHEVALKRTRPA